MMQNNKVWLALVPLPMLLSSGCAIIGDIFKAGAWTAVVGIALLACLVLGAVRILRGRGS